LPKLEKNIDLFNVILNIQMIKNELNAVAQFHEAFGIESADQPTISITQQTILLRHNLMKEENEEYLEAAQNNDMVEVADALGDMLYILCGTILSHGMQHKITEVFNEIQHSNMSKLGTDGKPIYREDGKVLKGPNYFKPRIAEILNKN
jgi:predicted HAD superfamily Cof-like phosphohydrolase